MDFKCLLQVGIQLKFGEAQRRASNQAKQRTRKETLSVKAVNAINQVRSATK